MIKNTEDRDGFGLQSISQVRLHNVARAYGWWIAKDSVSLHILKVCVNCAAIFGYDRIDYAAACGLYRAKTSHARVPERTIHPNIHQQSEINAVGRSGRHET